MNEVLSDAVLTKRLKKQIVTLEKELTRNRNEMERQVQELQNCRQKLIRSKPDKNRRRTWAADVKVANSDTSLVESTFEPKNDVPKIDFRELKKKPKTRFEDYGYQVEYSDEQFNNFLSASIRFGEFQEDDSNGPGGLLCDRPNVRESTSQLKTPKSFRKTRQSLLSDQQISPMIATTIDKDKRIRDLENEIEELQQFQKMEIITAKESASK